MILRCLMIVLLILPSLAFAQTDIADRGQIGTVIPVPSQDEDVTIFYSRPKPEAIAKLAPDQQTLEKNLNFFLMKGANNLTAFLAGHAPAQYDAFIQEWISGRLETLPPPFLYAMAAKYDATDTREALRWYMRGHVLAHVDAQLCLDKSAGQGVTYLKGMLGKKLSADLARFNADGVIDQELKAAVAYAQGRKMEYEPMWLCSHGISSFSGGNPGFKPLETRETILKDMDRKLREKH